MPPHDCADIYFFNKFLYNYDVVSKWRSKAFYDFNGKIQYMELVRLLPEIILYVGLFMHLLKIELKESHMLALTAFFNLVNSVPILYMPFDTNLAKYYELVSQGS